MKRSLGLIEGGIKTSEVGVSSATSSSICESAMFETCGFGAQLCWTDVVECRG